MYLFKNRKQSDPTREQKQVKMLKRMGVEFPQPRNGARNSMLTQIENNHTKLNSVEDQQRYMVSPHTDVSNFLKNARGMGQQAVRDDHPVVRPVFKDEKQRLAFNEMASQKLSSMGSFSALKSDNSRNNHRAYQQLADWSTKDHAMMNFSKIDKTRSHPIVFVQGHGSPGVKSISSDGNEPRQSSKDVAKMLHGMDLPNVSEVRANSCHSGTQFHLKSLTKVQSNFKDQTVYQHAGAWKETFAGSLESELSAVSDKRHNRVRGYMGPTTQGYVNTKALAPFGSTVDKSHTAVKLGGSNEALQRFKHGDVSRVNASVPGK